MGKAGINNIYSRYVPCASTSTFTQSGTIRPVRQGSCAQGPGGTPLGVYPTLNSPNAPELLLTWYVPTTIVQYVTRKIH